MILLGLDASIPHGAFRVSPREAVPALNALAALWNHHALGGEGSPDARPCSLDVQPAVAELLRQFEEVRESA